MKNHFKMFLTVIFLFIFTACTNGSTSVPISSGLNEDSLSAGSTSETAVQALGGLSEMNKKPEKEKLHFKETSESTRGKLDCFADEDGTEYAFLNETGEFLSFVKIRSKITLGSEITEREAQNIADATAILFADISKYEYRVCQPRGGYPNGINFQIDSYDFSYYKTLSGYKATEGIIVWTLSDGSVIFVHLSNIGKFDGLAEPKIDEKELDARFMNEVKKQHGDDAVVAQIYSRILDYENSQFIMQYDFELNAQHGHGRQEIMIPV